MSPEALAPAPQFGSREELAGALQAKGWAVFASADGGTLAGAPKGDPTDDGCPCCSGVEAVRMDGEGLMLTGACAIFAGAALWGAGPQEERAFVLVHQGAETELDDVSVLVNEIPTPQQAEEIVREAAKRKGT